MAIVLSEALEQLFTLRDHRAATIEKFILAEAELQAHVQQNTGKEYIELDDLETTHRLLQPVEKLKTALEKTNAAFEEMKSFFLNLLEASGCNKLLYTNKEVDEHGHHHDVPYTISCHKNKEGFAELLIQPKHT